MAFFKKIKAFNRKIETAMVIDKLLKEMSKTPLYRLHIEKHNTEALARMMVDGAWANNRDVLTGQFGLMPHRLAAAAFTISRSLTTLEGTNFSDLIPVLSVALASLLDEIETNAPFYGFNSLDGELVRVALETLAEMGDNET